jgi:hypothetical protein
LHFDSDCKTIIINLRLFSFILNLLVTILTKSISIMKSNLKLGRLSTLVLIFLLLNFEAGVSQEIGSGLSGAWQLKDGPTEEVLLFMDGYFTHTSFSKTPKSFHRSRGGTYEIKNREILATIEFDSKSKEEIGKDLNYSFSASKNELNTNINGKSAKWIRLDDGSAPLAGVWRITDRQQDGKIVPIHQSGTRKTLKILTGTRFQWAAIDPGTKEFSGTGGGTYSFANGKYTEQIEFFSRDSSRVGAKLGFDGKLESGKWHHSGLSSKGDKIYEIWGRIR